MKPTSTITLITQAMSDNVKLKDLLADSSAGNRRQVLWIDGVGGYLMCSQDEIVIGQAVSGSNVDVGIVGDLSRQAAAIRRSAGDYLLQPIQETRVDGMIVVRPQLLRSGQIIELGPSVKLRFTKPSPLSSTARLDLVSLHRWKPSVDGVLLLADSCIFGPRTPSHVHCPDWQHEMLLFKSSRQWCFRTAAEVQVGGKSLSGAIPITPGMRVRGDDFSFSVE